MPNWCANKVSLSHSDPAMIDKVMEGIKSANLFETFVPIGEWDYEKAVTAWGTKWDVTVLDYNRKSETDIDMQFDTAWGPPIAFFQALEEMGFTVRLLYDEPSMAFCGKYEDGFDEFFEYSGLSSDEIRDTVSEEVDSAFGISELAEEWENEQEEEEE